jgi:hypothetical protein
MLVDCVSAVIDKRPVDLVSIIYDNAHAQICLEYRHEVNEYGIVYCKSCGYTVESLNDITDSFCRACECPRTYHRSDGTCGYCGNSCGLKGIGHEGKRRYYEDEEGSEESC